MSTVIKWLVVSLAVAAPTFYLAVCAFMFATQRSQIFRPDTSRPDVASVGIPTLREITIDAGSGLDLLGWYVPPKPSRQVIVYFHGNGGNLFDRRDRLRTLTSAGLGVLMPEYPGYGGNPGRPSEAAFARAADAAMSFLIHQGMPLSRTAVYGESIGTGVATRLAVAARPAALILESPFTSLTDIVYTLFPWLPVRWLLLDRFDQLSVIKDLKSPLLVMQGGRDKVVPPSLGRKLFDAAPEPKKLWIAPEGGHEDLSAYGAMEVTIKFVEEHVN